MSHEDGGGGHGGKAVPAAKNRAAVPAGASTQASSLVDHEHARVWYPLEYLQTTDANGKTPFGAATLLRVGINTGCILVRSSLKLCI